MSPKPFNPNRRIAGRWHIGKCPKTGKRQFETLEDARRDAKRVRKMIGPKIKPYHCPYCKYWHNGHHRPPHRRQPKAVDNDLQK